MSAARLAEPVALAALILFGAACPAPGARQSGAQANEPVRKIERLLAAQQFDSALAELDAARRAGAGEREVERLRVTCYLGKALAAHNRAALGPSRSLPRF